jgi:hypothetical protein
MDDSGWAFVCTFYQTQNYNPAGFILYEGKRNAPEIN